MWTEGWVAEQMFCPNCGERRIEKHKANNPAADFHCKECREEFELKSQKTKFGRRIVDGALATMMSRLERGKAANLLIMRYDRDRAEVTDLTVVPKQFFVPAIIEPRKPLAATARRAGWQGCNILLSDVPEAGKIWLVHDSVMRDPDEAVAAWKSTLFLRDTSLSSRGWLIDVMKCVEEIGRSEFVLADVYAFEQRLSAVHPNNANVRPKIRQQLQVLRDMGFVKFLGDGKYLLGRLN